MQYVFEGEAQEFFQSNQHKLEANDIIQIPTNVHLAVKAIQRFKMMLVLSQA